jgi:periplasmic protein TonB
MWRLTTSVMAAGVLHAAVLGGAAWTHLRSDGVAGAQATSQAARGAPKQAAGWQWRLVQASATGAAGLAPEPQPNELPATAPQDAKPAQANLEPVAHDMVSKATATPGQARELYWARGELTRPPQTLGPVDIPYPPGVSRSDRYRAVLELFIDEQGAVRRVQLAEGDLPGAFEDAARNSFMAASFTPGERQSRPVKSRIRVEVVFDDTPLEPASRSVASMGR